MYSEWVLLLCFNCGGSEEQLCLFLLKLRVSNILFVYFLYLYYPKMRSFSDVGGEFCCVGEPMALCIDVYWADGLSIRAMLVWFTSILLCTRVVHCLYTYVYICACFLVSLRGRLCLILRCCRVQRCMLLLGCDMRVILQSVFARVSCVCLPCFPALLQASSGWYYVFSMRAVSNQ